MRKTNKKTLFNITSVLLMTLLLIYLFTTNIYAIINRHITHHKQGVTFYETQIRFKQTII